MQPPTPVVEDGNNQEPHEQGGLDLELPELVEPFPKAGDSYKAHARVAHKSLLTGAFHAEGRHVAGLFLPDAHRHGLRALGQAGRRAGTGRAGSTASSPSPVSLEGRDFDLLSEYIGEHRIRWVRERGHRAFGEESGTVITDITITPLE